MPSVLLIDDSELILQMLEMVCQQAGFETKTVTNLDDARSVLEGSRFDAVITDLNMPDVADPVAEIRAICDVPVVIVSGQPQADLDLIAAERGAAGAVSKDSGMMGMATSLPALLTSLTS